MRKGGGPGNDPRGYAASHRSQTEMGGVYTHGHNKWFKIPRCRKWVMRAKSVGRLEPRSRAGQKRQGRRLRHTLAKVHKWCPPRTGVELDQYGMIHHTQRSWRSKGAKRHGPTHDPTFNNTPRFIGPKHKKIPAYMRQWGTRSKHRTPSQW